MTISCFFPANEPHSAVCTSRRGPPQQTNRTEPTHTHWACHIDEYAAQRTMSLTNNCCLSKGGMLARVLRRWWWGDRVVSEQGVVTLLPWPNLERATTPGRDPHSPRHVGAVFSSNLVSYASRESDEKTAPTWRGLWGTGSLPGVVARSKLGHGKRVATPCSDITRSPHHHRLSTRTSIPRLLKQQLFVRLIETL